MRPLVVTGCGRSGTRYTAAVLAAAGYGCDHERVFSIDGFAEATLSSRTVEVSSFAAPFLPYVAHAAVVAHQTRHPLRTIASALASGFPDSPGGRWATTWLPAIDAEPTAEKAALRWWHDWNRLVEPHAHVTWRVEDLDARGLSAALTLAGRSCDRVALALALDRVPRDVGASPDPRALTWDDLPPGDAFDAARRLATRYGYGEEARCA